MYVSDGWSRQARLGQAGETHRIGNIKFIEP